MDMTPAEMDAALRDAPTEEQLLTDRTDTIGWDHLLPEEHGEEAAPLAHRSGMVI
jgi:hypothetical protein